jgi:hypothetical protein
MLAGGRHSSRQATHTPAGTRKARLDQAVVENWLSRELLALQQRGVAQTHDVAPATIALQR